MSKQKRSPLIILIFSLIVIGFTFVSISSLTEANNTVGDRFYFLRKQGFWIIISLLAFFLFSKIKLNLIKKLSALFYLFSIICLILVLIPGLSNSILGARRWLNLGPLSFQPSELLKLSSVIYFANLFSQESKKTFFNLLIYLIGPFILIILEPNLSTALLIFAISISMFYLSGGKITPIITLCSCFILLAFILVITSPYRLNRLQTLINPQETESSYHNDQIILSLSSGGFFGKGFANSDQKYRFLPKVSTDSILAIIGEEMGFLGTFTILIIYTLLVTHLIKTSSLIKDQFTSLIISGTACWITFQALINIAAIANVIPLTGVPLPFISYGGSSLITLMVAIGLTHNIEKKYGLLLYSDNDQKNHNHRHSFNSGPRTHSSTSTRPKNKMANKLYRS
jgi:cell division protein FtsW